MLTKKVIGSPLKATKYQVSLVLKEHSLDIRKMHYSLFMSGVLLTQITKPIRRMIQDQMRNEL